MSLIAGGTPGKKLPANFQIKNFALQTSAAHTIVLFVSLLSFSLSLASPPSLGL